MVKVERSKTNNIQNLTSGALRPSSPQQAQALSKQNNEELTAKLLSNATSNLLSERQTALQTKQAKSQTNERAMENLKVQEHLAKWSEFYKPRLLDFTYLQLEHFWHSKIPNAGQEKPQGQKLIELAEAALFLKVNQIGILKPTATQEE